MSEVFDDENQKGGGRGRPPKKSQFKPGQSGNPKGRPPKPRDLKKLVDAELDRVVPIMRNGRQVRVTKREFMINNLVNAAVRCEDKALQALLKIIGTAPEPEPVTSVDPAELARFAMRYLPLPDVNETDAKKRAAEPTGDDLVGEREP